MKGTASSNFNRLRDYAGNLELRRRLTKAGEEARTEFLYDGGHQIAKWEDFVGGTGTGLSYAEHDSRGRRESSSRWTAIVYTSFDLPRSMESTDGSIQAEFLYDAFGQRVARNVNGARTITAGAYRSENFGKLHIHAVMGPEGPIAELRVDDDSGESSYHYLHRNYRGDTLAVSDESGNVVERREYSPFGRRLGADHRPTLAPLPVSSVVPGFTGHEQDEELGFVNMGGRLFDPETVSFLSQDPFVAAPLHGPSWHGYSYVQHSPTQFVDPSGFLDEPIGPEVKIVADDVESNVMECNDEGCVQNIRFGHSSSASASGEMPTSVGEPAQPGYGQSSGAGSRPPSPEEIWETVKGIATGVGEFLAGLVPGVGEAQDVAVIVDPDSAWWEVGLAAGSLGVSVITLGTSPNFGGAIRGGRTIAETVGGVGRAADDVAGSVAGAADNVAEGVSELGGAARAADEGPILFGQQAVSRTFTPPDGPRPSDFEFAGQPIADVAAGIRRGEISPDQIPFQFVRIEGQGRVAVNNRSLTTLRRAGVEPTRAIEVTSPLVERRVRSRLREMGGRARDTIRIRGGPNSRTSAIF